MVSNTLLQSPARDGDDVSACAALVDADGAGPVHLVYISFATSPEARLDRLRAHLSVRPDRTAVFSVGSQRRHGRSGVTVGTPSASDGGPSESVEYVSIPNSTDLAKVGLALDKHLSAAPSGRVVVCFDSVNALVDVVGRERAFHFVHRLTAYLDSIGADAHYHLHADAGSSLLRRSFRLLFDEVVDAADVLGTASAEASGVGPGDETPHRAVGTDGSASVDAAAGTEPTDLRSSIDRLWSATRAAADAAPAAPESPSGESGFEWLRADDLEDGFEWLDAADLAAPRGRRTAGDSTAPTEPTRQTRASRLTEPTRPTESMVPTAPSTRSDAAPDLDQRRSPGESAPPVSSAGERTDADPTDRRTADSADQRAATDGPGRGPGRIARAWHAVARGVRRRLAALVRRSLGDAEEVT